MDLLAKLKEAAASNEFVESKNYYFQRHICDSSGEEVKVMLDYTLSSQTSDEILRFGLCPCCGKCFYHKDYESKEF
ncbi:MAG: hypothetical protein Q4F63_05580 [Clostridia bacterium]|nr:hypothetical protein [Clostridia bacterium]